MKRMICALLLVPLMALAEAESKTEVFNGHTWTYYTVKNGTKVEAVVGTERLASVRKRAVNAGITGEVTIPSTLGGYPVTGVGDGAFKNLTGITSIIVPEGVRSILACAFWECTNLKSITLPSTLTSVGADVFWGARAVKTVRIAKNADIEAVKRMLDMGGLNLTGVSFVRVDVSALKVNLTAKPNSSKYGSVRGSGSYAAGERVLLVARENSGYVFAGWYTDKDCKKKLNPEGYDNRWPTIEITMPSKATAVYAKFVSKSSDKKALKFSSATQNLAKSAKSYTAGKAMAALTLTASSASLPTLSMKDLPAGMTFDPATGKITGTPTKPGKYTATVTVKSAAGNKVSQKVKIYVTVPSGYYGTFGGYALVKTTPAYMTFTSDKYGAVSGKVTYKGKGYSFKASYSSASSTQSKFTPSIKIGSSTYKPVTYVDKATAGITVSEALGEQKGKFVFFAQKKPGLVAKKKALAKLIGQTVKVKYVKGDAAALPKAKDSLTLKFAETDAVKVSGKLKGRSVSFSTTVVYCDKKDNVYTAAVALIEPKSGYSRLATFTLTVDADGKVTKAVSFSKIKAEE